MKYESSGMIIFLLSCCIPLLMHYSCNISHCRWLMPRNRYSYFHHRINLCKNHLRKYLWMKIAVYGGWLESWFLEQLDLCKLFGYSKLRAYLTFPNHLSRTKKKKKYQCQKGNDDPFFKFKHNHFSVTYSNKRDTCTFFKNSIPYSFNFITFFHSKRI